MTRIIDPGIGTGYSRKNPLWKIQFTDYELDGKKANILDLIDYTQYKLVFRTLEAGPGLRIDLVDADNFFPETTPYQKIVLSIDSSALATISTRLEVRKDGTVEGVGSILNFLGPVKITQAVSGAPIDIAVGINVSENGTPVNTDPVQNLEFTGVSVSAVEVSPGHVKVDIGSTTGITVQVDGSSLPGYYSTLNWLNTPPGAITDGGGGVLSIDLSSISGFNTTQIASHTYTGTVVSSGQVVVSSFFGPYNPDPKDTLITINGLVLTYSPIPSQSDYQIVSGNLVLNLNNLGYSLEPGDEIFGRLWV